MREIKLIIWKEPNPEDSKKEKDVDLIEVLKILVSNAESQKALRGIDQHRFYGRLIKYFDEAEKTRVLRMEEVDYSQVKKIVEENIPAQWGLNKDINKAIEEFLNAKSVEI